jgi:tRNA(adenine34) deaminase
MEKHMQYMRQALAQAQLALDEGEFPVGCVLEAGGRIIARSRRTGTGRDIPSELDHAEMTALRHLEMLDEPIDRTRMTLYATLEPCLMCFGALLISGIGTIVYAFEDAMGGGTRCDRNRLPTLYRNADVHIASGVMRQESLALFKTYFSDPRFDYWRDSYLAQYTLSQ